MRRNLQREHLRKLGTMIVADRPNRSGRFAGVHVLLRLCPRPGRCSRPGPTPPQGDRRAHRQGPGAEGRTAGRHCCAHLEECHTQIGKILDASFDPERALTDSILETAMRARAPRPTRVIIPGAGRVSHPRLPSETSRPGVRSEGDRRPRIADHSRRLSAGRPGLPARSPPLRRGGRSGIPGRGASSRV